MAGSYLVFLKDVGGNEFNQIYRYDLPGGEITLLTDGGLQNGGVVVVHRRRPHRLRLHPAQGTDRDLYVMARRDPKSDRLLLAVRAAAGR